MSNADKSVYPLPHVNSDGTVQHDVHIGLTKREYFAAKAMEGILAGIYGGGGDNYRRQLTEWKETNGALTTVGEAAAKDALGYADELLKQLEK